MFRKVAVLGCGATQRHHDDGLGFPGLINLEDLLLKQLGMSLVLMRRVFPD